MIGVGAAIHMLKGGSEKNASDYYGLTISNVIVDSQFVIIEFDNGKKIKIYDDGQSCCESRYVTCDDDATCLIGGKLVKIEASPVEYKSEGYSDHETVFVEIATDKDHIKFCNHNEHNGYYGGFGLSICEV